MGPAAWASALVTLLLTGAIAGFFYAFSVAAMPGLDLARPDAAIQSMQRINRAVLNPVFFTTFFVTPVAALVTAFLAWRLGAPVPARWFGLAALVYLGGAFVPTVVINVPLNEALGRLDVPEAVGEAQRVWAEYSERWTRWNTVRTAFSVLSLLCVGLGLLAWPRQHGASIS